MPSEVVLNITRKRVTPVSGEGALGKWRTPYTDRPVFKSLFYWHLSNSS
jgi:hypothetical protein